MRRSQDEECVHIFSFIFTPFIFYRLPKNFADGVLYHGETWELMARRWGKLEKDFKLRDDKESPLFDISKIPDIYDCIKYDLQHNQAAIK